MGFLESGHFLVWRGLPERCSGLWECEAANLHWLDRKGAWGLKILSSHFSLLDLSLMLPGPNAWNHKEARGQGNLLKESIHAFSLSGQRGSGGVNQRHPALRGNLFWQHRSMVRNFPERKNNLRFLFLFFKCRYLDLLPTRRRFWIIRSGIGLMSVLLQQCKVFSRYSLDHTVRNISLNIEWGSCLRKLPLGANFHVKVFAENSWESRHPVTWWSIELSIYLWIKTLRI